MKATAVMPSLARGLTGRQADWVFPLLGLAVMYLPAYWSAAQTIWQSDEHAHGPMVLLVALALFWTRRRPLSSTESPAAGSRGWPLLVCGLMAYVAARTLSSSVLMFASQPLVVAGSLLLLKGTRGLRWVWFPVFYLVFMIPMPSVVIDAATGPLKQAISVIAETALYAVGYPIARSGVIISIGQYQMLIADACSGLHSMLSLTALGSLFLYLTARPSWWHNALMAAAILPIAFVANVIRVIALVLVTYHFGDEAGQGFLHGAAGIVLMLAALAALFSLDALLWAVRPQRRASAVVNRKQGPASPA